MTVTVSTAVVSERLTVQGVPLAITTYRPPEETCWCSITVGGGETNTVPVTEISSLGAVVGLKGELRRHEYADCILKVGNQPEVTLFAHVVNVRSSLVHLRWLHFEPGEEAALAERLRKLFANVSGVKSAESTGEDFAWRQEQGTRRIVRPRSHSTEDLSKDQPSAEPAGEGEERKTRRVVRPRQQSAGGALDGPATAPAEDSPEASEGAQVTGRSSRRQRAVQPTSTAAQSPSAGAAPSEVGQGSASRQVVTPRRRESAADEADEYEALDAKTDTATPTALAGAGDAPQPASAPQADDQQSSTAKPAPTTKPASGWRQRATAPSAEEADHVALVNTDRHLRSVADAPADTARFKDDASRKILSRARTVQASELAARHDKVRILNMSTIKELIKESVAEAVVDLNTGMSTDRLAEEVERRVDEQLKAFKAEKEDYEARAKRLEAELSNAKEAVERERKRAIEASSFTVSETGMMDLERRLERLVGSAIRRNGVSDALAEELRGMVTHILDDEREKIAENAKKSQADTIDLLERKIARLSTSLTESQKERDRQQRTLAAIEQSGGVGLRNVMTAGLDDDDPELERKKALMKEIIEQNRLMREDYQKRHGRLPGRVQADAAQAAASSPAPASASAPETQTEEADQGVVASEEVAAGGTADEPHLAATDVPTDLRVGEDEYTGPPQVDPDDLPWDGESFASEIDDDSPIKRINVSVSDAAAKAPPLAIRRSDSDAAQRSEQAAETGDEHDRLATEVADGHEQADDAEVNASPEVDPDDLPWEGPSDVALSAESDSPIKKISVSKQREPPPLERG